MRRRFYRFLRDKIFRIPEGHIAPRYLIAIRWVLFPLKCYILKNKWMNFDVETGIFTLYGVRYSEDLFLAWAKKGGIPLNTTFQIIQRDNGVITIGRIGEIGGSK